MAGRGGYGVKFLGEILGEILILKRYNVSLTFDYDAASRGGDIIGYLKFSDGEIENPVVDEADLLLRFTHTIKKFKAEKKIIDSQIKDDFKDSVDYEFTKEAINRFDDKKLANMIALGVLLKELRIDVNEEELRKIITKGFEKNHNAIKHGLRL